jgi:hypothetical protein
MIYKYKIIASIYMVLDHLYNIIIPCIQKHIFTHICIICLIQEIKKKKDICTVVRLFILSRNYYYIQKHYSSIKVKNTREWETQK